MARSYTFTYDMFNAAGTTYDGVAICGIGPQRHDGGNMYHLIHFALTTGDFD